MWLSVHVPVQGQSTYSRQIKQVEDDIQQLLKKINELTGRRQMRSDWLDPAPASGCVVMMHWSYCAGIKESDTGLAPPALWDLAADKQTLQSEQPLQVARCVSDTHCHIRFKAKCLCSRRIFQISRPQDLFRMFCYIITISTREPQWNWILVDYFPLTAHQEWFIPSDLSLNTT